MILREGVVGIEKRIHDTLGKLDITRPGDYKKIKYLNSLLLVTEGLRHLGKHYSQKAAAMAETEAGILMMLNKGVPLPKAYNWCPCGCVETSLAGKQRCYTSYADYNLGAIVEFALNDGRSRKYDRQIAAHTGDPRTFETYEQFLEAVKDQIRYVLKCMVAGNQVTKSSAIWNARSHP